MHEDERIVVERGTDRSQLVIAFTGVQGNLSLRPFDFWDLTGTLGWSRILLRDPARLWFLRGIDDQVRSFAALVEHLRGHVDDLRPDRVTVIGNSMGGFAAVLAGHRLGADEVHAFGPPVSINPLRLAREGSDLLRLRGVDIVKLAAARPRQVPSFDLPFALRRHNGRTSYFVHVLDGSHPAKEARRLATRPGVEVLTYPGTTDVLMLEMARSGYLKQLFRRPPGETPGQLHARVYANAAARA